MIGWFEAANATCSADSFSVYRDEKARVNNFRLMLDAVRDQSQTLQTRCMCEVDDESN